MRRYSLFTQIISLPILALSLRAADNSWATNSSVAKTESGFIRGRVADTVVSFKGIPYAEPPIEDLRWRPPQAVVPWRHIRAMTDFGADCMQKPDTNDAAPAGKTPAEDCLYLNVWTPQNPTSPSLPVLVWLHGGAFVNGGASPPLYDGTSFAKKGVVFVSLNYRLARFGFFAHPALSAANEGPLGNYGLMDQMAALEWVQRNISAFGGDPNQVTLMGESAGGISVLAHMISPLKKNLFHRAIIMSGGGRYWGIGGKEIRGDVFSAEETGVHFAKSVGIVGNDAAALTALRNLSAEKIVGDLNMTKLLLDPKQMFIYAGGPIHDGNLLVMPPEKTLKQKKFLSIPVLIGTTDRDLSLETAKTKAILYAGFGGLADRARALYDPDGQKELKILRQEIGADKMMNEPARFVAKQISGMGQRAWLYRFAYVAESERSQSIGATHASELPFLFNTLKVRYGAKVTDNDQAMAESFSAYLTNFAKARNPNGSGLPMWSEFDPANLSIQIFGLNGPSQGPDPWQARIDLVEELAENPVRTMSKK